MKKFLQGALEWKIWASLMFTGSVLLYCIINLFLGYKSLEISTILSLLIVSAVGTFIQFLAFTEYIIKNLRYSIRMIIFVVPFSVLLAVCAVGFHWFPVEITGAWIMFIGIFILVFIAITIGFEIYFRVTG
ncbi:MAG: hypothetical protein RRZ42_04930, partial [Oscillospiraceae bacterium]